MTRGLPKCSPRSGKALRLRFDKMKPEAAMTRGVVPRQPAKTGRQEIARSVPRVQQSRGISRQPKAVQKSPQKPAKKTAASTSPQRVQEILKRLEQTYPDVTCAL